MTISHSVLFGIRNVSDKICGENQNTRFMFNSYFLKPYLLCDNVEKCRRGGHGTNDNMAHAHCMLDT